MSIDKLFKIPLFESPLVPKGTVILIVNNQKEVLNLIEEEKSK